MITEANALEMAQYDIKKLHKSLDEGAMPDTIARAVIGRILKHVKGFRNQNAEARAIEAANRRMTAPTFSEHLVARCMAVSMGAMRMLPPEDSRALGLWLIGTPPQVPGFLQQSIAGLNEPSGAPAADHAAKSILQLFDRMQRVDDDLFKRKVKVLTPPRQRIIQGLLLDAQWAFQERDGRTARSRIISARRAAQTWLKQKQKMSMNEDAL